MAKFKEIAYELSKMWKYLTREEIRDYFGISDRSLYYYQSTLGLKKEMQTPLKAGKSMSVYINTKDNQIKKQTFKSWEHFAAWSKAQAHPYIISEPNVINMDYNRVTEEAQRFNKLLK